ncbi:unnamed protein product [Bemisia tabaci]|uniref:Uncharacterized protein n=1 Tax=Bemisia tabaci TaxID=7038 RepID=A0A9P0A5M9_BEMTA|nr:unnamed protein product [Bemisia tabaci]
MILLYSILKLVKRKEWQSVKLKKPLTHSFLPRNIRLFLQKKKGTAASTSGENPQNIEGRLSSNNNVKLPRLELPKFSGKINEWSAFYSLFEASIHKARNLNDIEKFQYLLSKLEGEARQLVGTLELTAENYSVAWDSLCIRYNNERRHVHHHLTSFLELPDAHQNASLPNLLTKVREHINALTALKKDKNSYSLLLTTIVISKLSFTLRRRFEDSREDSSKYPEFDELEKFLQAECSQLNNYTTRTNSDSHAKTSQNKSGNSRNFVATENNFHQETSKGKQSRSKNQEKSVDPSCDLCKSPHAIYRCEKFHALTVKGRREKIQEFKRCPNCLSISHENTQDCKSKYRCHVCSEKHHTLLHQPQGSFLSTSDDSSGNMNLASKNGNQPTIKETTILEQSGSSPKFSDDELTAELATNKEPPTVQPTARVKTRPPLTTKVIDALPLKQRKSESKILHNDTTVSHIVSVKAKNRVAHTKLPKIPKLASPKELKKPTSILDSIRMDAPPKRVPPPKRTPPSTAPSARVSDTVDYYPFLPQSPKSKGYSYQPTPPALQYPPQFVPVETAYLRYLQHRDLTHHNSWNQRSMFAKPSRSQIKKMVRAAKWRESQGRCSGQVKRSRRPTAKQPHTVVEEEEDGEEETNSQNQPLKPCT